MKHLTLLVILTVLPLSSFAEVCEGMNACTDLYRKLTGDKVVIDDKISDEMTLAVNGTDLTPQNARGEFPLFLNKNAVNFMGNKLTPVRNGEFLGSPIYVVSANNMPQMINKDGLMTMVYHAKNETKKLITPKLLGMLSKKKTKGLSRVVDFKASKIVIVSDTFEYATKIMNEIIKADK
ncbi:MAG: hypothetical protein K2Q18_12400 [Bdellovibrionales bacterium]|nr:hypothetical protein [Bdellovibrionales bacterium]